MTGALLVVLYTVLMTAADGLTKFVAGGYAAPQVFVISAGLVALMSWGLAQSRAQRQSLKVRSVGWMAARTVLTILASVGFFKALYLLPLADVFLFVGLIPLVAAALSGPFLAETPRPTAWVALAIGLTGILFLMPEGLGAVKAGHFWALLGVLSGTGSLLAARVISKVERAPLAQVFWPNLGLMISMAVVAPFVWKPLTMLDFTFIVAYAIALFAARYVVVEALRLLPTYVATSLMNLQFVWMIFVGYVFFAELPTMGTLAGAALIIGSGLWLVVDENQAAKARLVPAE
ncbi:MAG: DMT family transporter [Pelagimonas sp.]|jgi:S-adenosylmethionine uptake transporter|nr:DMT family transporter [Pelagimonas sp.]